MKFFSRGVSLRQRIYISKRISYLLGAGISLPQALNMIAGQIKYGNLLTKLASDISVGQSITQVFSKTQILGASAAALLKIAEDSGTLAESFLAISEELEKRSVLQQKILGAILYPACISLGMIVLIVVLMTVIFPKMLGVFKSLHVDLPISTRVLMWLSVFIQQWGIFVGSILLIAFIGLWVYYKRSRFFHLKVDKLIMHVPVFSIFIRTYMLASISRVVGLLLSNNSSLIMSLQSASETCGNYAYVEAMKNVIKQVSSGNGLGKALANFPKLFPKEYCDLVAIGEQTGKLSETFAYAHTLYARDLDSLTKSLSSSIEPVLMVVIGLAIGVVAFSVVTPMYSITSHLHGT